MSPAAPMPNPFDSIETKGSWVDPQVKDSLEKEQVLLLEMHKARAHRLGHVGAESIERRSSATPPREGAMGLDGVSKPYVPGRLSAEIERQEMEAAYAQSTPSSPGSENLSRGSFVLTDRGSTRLAEELAAGDLDATGSSQRSIGVLNVPSHHGSRRSSDHTGPNRARIAWDPVHNKIGLKTVTAKADRHGLNSQQSLAPDPVQQLYCGQDPALQQRNQGQSPAIPQLYQEEALCAPGCEAETPGMQNAGSAPSAQIRPPGLSREDLERSFLDADRDQEQKMREIEQLFLRVVEVEPLFAGSIPQEVVDDPMSHPDEGVRPTSALEPILERDSDNGCESPVRDSARVAQANINDGKRINHGSLSDTGTSNRLSNSLPHAGDAQRPWNAEQCRAYLSATSWIRDNDDENLGGTLQELQNEVVLLRKEKRALLQGRQGLIERQNTLAADNHSLSQLVSEQRKRIENLERSLEKLQLPETARAPSLLLPFNRTCLGINLSISPDGYRLRREQGCRQSIAMGLGALEKTQQGYWFEVIVDSHDPSCGWVGGMGIGVTRSPEDILSKSSDKTWKLPDTFTIGYWGRLFCYGKEYKAPWNLDELKSGDVVGFLVTPAGAIALFVNSILKAYIAAQFPMNVTTPVYPVVDVFGSTVEVTLVSTPSVPPTIPADVVPQALREVAGDRNKRAKVSGRPA